MTGKAKRSAARLVALLALVLLGLLLSGCGGALGTTTVRVTMPPAAAGFVRALPDAEQTPAEPDPESEGGEEDFVLNTNTRRYHDPSCSSVEDIKPENRWRHSGTREEIEAWGYVACKRCGG